MTSFYFQKSPAGLANCFPEGRFLPHGSAWIWQIPIPTDVEIANRLAIGLRESERARADRFLVPHARHAFVATRAAVRILLGRALGIASGEVEIAIAAGGKPMLTGPAAARLSFNLSHSGTVAMVALADGRPIGVDVECVRAEVNFLDLSHRHFPPAEHDALARAGAAEARRAFFQAWARREAFLKAMGVGLGVPLDAITLAEAADGAFRPQMTVTGEREDAWYGRDLPVEGVEAAAALCWEGRIEEIVMRQFVFS
jgi:4'-phosphopantetheinyl transferase